MATQTGIGRNVLSLTRGDVIEPTTCVKVFYGYDPNGMALYAQAGSDQPQTVTIPTVNKYDIDTNPIEQGSISSASGTDATGNTRLRTVGYIPVEPSTEYTISCDINRVFVIQYPNASTSGYVNRSSGWQSGSGYTFTTNAATHYIRMTFSVNDSQVVTPSDLTWIMLNEGDTALPWEEYGDKTVVIPPSTYEVEIKTIPDGTQAQGIADNILAGLQYKGYDIVPYTATGVELSPLMELGDLTDLDGVGHAELGSIVTTISKAMWADISVPGIPQDDEFGYTAETQRKLDRAEQNNAVNKASISVNADAIQAEVLARTDGDRENRTYVEQTAESLTVSLETYADTAVENHAAVQRKYIRYSASGLELGDEDKKTRAILDDTKLAFYDPTGKEKAYIGGDPNDLDGDGNPIYKFFVEDGKIVNKLEFGEHWVVVASGSDNDNRLTFKWRG